MWVQSLGWEDSLEEKMASHSSILAWKIPWTEEPGRLHPWTHKESDMTEHAHIWLWGFPGGSLLKSPPANAGGEGNGIPLQYSCLENPMDGGAWWAAVHGVTKSRTWLSNFSFTVHFHALEKEMATHSSVLAWRIPGTGEPGRLPSLGLHRVGHDWSDAAAASANVGDAGSIPGLGRPLEKKMATHSSILAWEIYDQGSMVGYSPWSQTWFSN